jgi:hypothetical protein
MSTRTFPKGLRQPLRKPQAKPFGVELAGAKTMNGGLELYHWFQFLEKCFGSERAIVIIAVFIGIGAAIVLLIELTGAVFFGAFKASCNPRSAIRQCIKLVQKRKDEEELRQFINLVQNRKTETEQNMER